MAQKVLGDGKEFGIQEEEKERERERDGEGVACCICVCCGNYSGPPASKHGGNKEDQRANGGGENHDDALKQVEESQAQVMRVQNNPPENVSMNKRGRIFGRRKQG